MRVELTASLLARSPRRKKKALTIGDGAQVRIGPYGDVVRGRDDYVGFLEKTVTALAGYELRVERVIAGGSAIVAELHETVDTEKGRLRTHEAIVFDVEGAVIRRVAVYLRKSHLAPR